MDPEKRLRGLVEHLYKSLIPKAEEAHSLLVACAQLAEGALKALEAARGRDVRSAEGAISLYKTYKSLSLGLEELKSKVGRGYQVKLDGIKGDLKKYIKDIQAGLKELYRVTGYLARIYERDIKGHKVSSELREVEDEMIATYKL
jgi:hypothetical protein